MSEPASTIDKPVTWRSVTRVALVWAAEYALLSMIEDAPVVLKAMTIICATGALFALESEIWLKKRRYWFPSALIILGVVYLLFVAYAIYYTAVRSQIKMGLQKLYSSATPLVNRHIDVSKDAHYLEQEQVTKFKIDFEKWETNSANWIKENVGATARDQFLDRGNTTIFSMWGDRPDQEYDYARNRLSGDRRNLIAIMESRIYGD